MNSNTKQALIEFTHQVQNLVAATVVQIGIQTASEVLTACVKLEQALNTDETITETR